MVKIGKLLRQTVRGLERNVLRPVVDIAPTAAVVIAAVVAAPTLVPVLASAGISTATATVVAPVLAQAATGAVVATVSGQNPVKGAVCGTINGACGPIAGPVANAALQHQNVERAFLGAVVSSVISGGVASPVVAPVLAASSNAAITKQDIVQAGMLAATVSLGTQAIKQNPPREEELPQEEKLPETRRKTEAPRKEKLPETRRKAEVPPKEQHLSTDDHHSAVHVHVGRHEASAGLSLGHGLSATMSAPHNKTGFAWTVENTSVQVLAGTSDMYKNGWRLEVKTSQETFGHETLSQAIQAETTPVVVHERMGPCTGSRTEISHSTDFAAAHTVHTSQQLHVNNDCVKPIMAAGGATAAVLFGGGLGASAVVGLTAVAQ